MVVFLVSNGFDYNYICWDISFFELHHLFVNLLKNKLRLAQHASGILIGSIGTFFQKDKGKTYIDLLQEQINSLDFVEQKEKIRKKVDFSNIIKVLKRK